MRILAIGDVVGKPGLTLLSNVLPPYKRSIGADLTIVNGENACGTGILPSQAEEIFNAGADVITTGNHIWRRREIFEYLDECPYILRPLNYAEGSPGKGMTIIEAAGRKVAVINLLGRAFTSVSVDNPFTVADMEISKLPPEVNTVVVDFHADATSEKAAFLYHMQNKGVSVIFGTHTHVQTADERIVGKTGFISDLGMTGPIDSVIGVRPEQSVSNFLGFPPSRYDTAQGNCVMCGALFEINGAGECISVERVQIEA